MTKTYDLQGTCIGCEFEDEWVNEAGYCEDCMIDKQRQREIRERTRALTATQKREMEARVNQRFDRVA